MTAEKRKKPAPVPARRKTRVAALDARGARKKSAKQEGAFWNRLHEHEALARTLSRRHGVEPGHARRIAMGAPTSPVSSGGLRRKGRPPSGFDLYEAVECTRDGRTGELPVGRGFAFWESVTRQWNASNSEEHPERMYITEDGAPDWRTLQSAYRIAARAIKAKADALYEAHKIACAICAATNPQ